MLLIGISINQLKSLPEGSTALGLPVSTGAYIYTVIFVSDSSYTFDCITYLNVCVCLVMRF